MEQLLYFALFSPLAGFLFLLFSSFFIKRKMAEIIGCGTIALSLLLFAYQFYLYESQEIVSQSFVLFDWIPIPGINAQFKLVLDTLSLWMTLIITGVGFLILVYSTGYMEDERDFARYFACLNLFIFSMLLLVLAGHLLLLFVGWEGVGLASYLLIGFWFEKPAANQAATKAFVMNRIGDFAFIIALLLTFYLFGTGDIAEISLKAGISSDISSTLILLTTFLYFLAATGKSAQFPLYTWLPDAMEGPTPVSALIHAATMVTAGVYLMVRLHFLFLMAPETMNIVGVVGGFTSLFAAFCAVAQTDLKRVLAYSTISQIGLMFLACGVGAFYPAMFHLTTHAFIKALLFLCAGNVIHMLHGVTEMEEMGGLRKKLPVTHILFLTGVLGLSGVPPLAAFFSKDMILEQEYLSGHEVLFIVGLIASILTAFYMTRAYCLTFLGSPQGEKATNAREAPAVMLFPITILGLLTVVGGYIGCVFCESSFLEEFLGRVNITVAEKEPLNFLTPETWLSIFGAFFGVGAALFIYTQFKERLGSPIKLFNRSFFINEAYWKYFAEPLRKIAQSIVTTIEPSFFDASLKQVERGTSDLALKLQLLQNGEIRSYASWMIIGVLITIVYFVF